jgi:hypothetical protein
MKHYKTRIAFAEKEIKRLSHDMSYEFYTESYEKVDVDFYLKKLNQANRIRKHYISKNYEYVRARMNDKLDYRAKELGDFNNPSTPLG